MKFPIGIIGSVSKARVRNAGAAQLVSTSTSYAVNLPGLFQDLGGANGLLVISSFAHSSSTAEVSSSITVHTSIGNVLMTLLIDQGRGAAGNFLSQSLWACELTQAQAAAMGIAPSNTFSIAYSRTFTRTWMSYWWISDYQSATPIIAPCWQGVSANKTISLDYGALPFGALALAAVSGYRGSTHTWDFNQLTKRFGNDITANSIHWAAADANVNTAGGGNYIETITTSDNANDPYIIGVGAAFV